MFKPSNLAMAWQLAGAKLLGAKLPAAIAKFEGLNMVDELSKRARTLFVGIISGCLYSWITIATTGNGSSPSVFLPIVATKIPIALFDFTAPAILFVAYVWFNFYLQPLWDTLVRLPSTFPDGSLLYEKVQTWLPIAMIHLYVPTMKNNRPTFSGLKGYISIALFWWMVPITLLIFAWVSVLNQRWEISAWQSLLLLMAIVGTYTFHKECKRTLQGDMLMSPKFKQDDK